MKPKCVKVSQAIQILAKQNANIKLYYNYLNI